MTPEWPEETHWEFLTLADNSVKICHRDINGNLWEYTATDGFIPVDKFQLWIHEVLTNADDRME